jgi:O-methyltransferase
MTLSLKTIYQNYASIDNVHGSDKGTTHQYMSIYEEVFTPLKNDIMNVLEIGIFSGAWLEVMHHFFQNATIYGMDININNLRFAKNLPRVNVFECDATKSASLNNVENIVFKIIIDDGSHYAQDILNTFDLYYNKLSKDGVYIIEDVNIDGYPYLIPLLQQKCDERELELEVRDLRYKTGRFDDVICIIKYKNNKMDTDKAIFFVNKLEGAYVECGVYEGAHPKLCADLTLQNNLPIRNIYMFDTYEGLTEPGEYDYTSDATLLYKMTREQVYNEWKNNQKNDVTNGWCYCSLENVKKNVEQSGYPKDKLFYIKGDVCETLLNKENIPDKIAVLRLDTDWYESTKIELEVLYDKVVPGGVIIFDDYFHWDGQRRAVDDFFKNKGINVIVEKVNERVGCIIKK